MNSLAMEAPSNPPMSQPATAQAKPSPWAHWRGLMEVAIGMMLHDRMKLLGGLIGVVFATVLATQQAGTFLGLMAKNTMLVDRSDADIWIVQRGMEQLQPGRALPEYVLHRAETTPGVAWATPLLWTGSTVALPQGGTEAVTVLGVDVATLHMGPWNVVAGRPENLRLPDAMFFEDSERDKFGGLNLGDVRELNGHRVQAVGFTWGLLPFGPSYAFTSYDKARELSGQRDRSQTMVLAKVQPGASVDATVQALQAALPDTTVYSKEAYARSIVRFLLTRSPIGITFGTAALFGLIVGFVIVAISMFSAVLDNIREFGTLKAIGATFADLAVILMVQAFIYASLGSGLGLTLMGFVAAGIRSPRLGMVLPPALILGTPALMLAICMGASILALLRLRKLEPAMVFRG